MSTIGVIIGFIGLGGWLLSIIGNGLAALSGHCRRSGKYRGRDIF